MVRHYVWDYQPDLIMLQFFAANDVCNNSRKLDPDTARPYYTLHGESLVLDDSFLQDPQHNSISDVAMDQAERFRRAA